MTELKRNDFDMVRTVAGINM